MNEVRITKWLQRSDYIWCVNECKRIKESTGDQCKIEKEGKGKNDRIAIIRMMSTE